MLYETEVYIVDKSLKIYKKHITHVEEFPPEEITSYVGASDEFVNYTLALRGEYAIYSEHGVDLIQVILDKLKVLFPNIIITGIITTHSKMTDFLALKVLTVKKSWLFVELFTGVFDIEFIATYIDHIEMYSEFYVKYSPTDLVEYYKYHYDFVGFTNEYILKVLF